MGADLNAPPQNEQAEASETFQSAARSKRLVWACAGTAGNGNQLPVRNVKWRHPVGEDPGIVPGRFCAYRKDRSEGGGNTFVSPPHFDLSPGAALGVLRSRALSSDQPFKLSPTQPAVASSVSRDAARRHWRASSSFRSRSAWISGARPAR